MSGNSIGVTLTLLFVPGLALRAEPPEIVPSRIERLFPFREGGKDGKWGYIDRDGAVVVSPRFRDAGDFSDGLARVQTENGICYIDVRGKIAFVCRDELRDLDWTLPFRGGLASFAVKGKCGFFDRFGRVVVAPKYDDVYGFSEGLAAVNEGAKSIGFPRPAIKRGGKWGFIDQTGRLVIPLQFDEVEHRGFTEGFAQVTLDDKYCYIDKSGKKVLTPEYKSA